MPTGAQDSTHLVNSGERRNAISYCCFYAHPERGFTGEILSVEGFECAGDDIVPFRDTSEMIDKDRPSGLLPIRTKRGVGIRTLVVCNDERRQYGVLG